MKSANNSIHTKLKSHIFGIGVFAALFAFFFFAGGLVAANGQSLGPTDSHIVSVYIDGQETSVPTRATTVDEFLSRANIKINAYDLVEPSLNTPIDANNFRIQIFRAKPVTIIDGPNQQHILTPYNNAKLIAEKAGYVVYPEDNLTLTTTTNFVQDNIIGEKLIINRATPISMSLYGTPPAIYRTQAKTVGDFLKERNIQIATGATVTPGENTSISANLPIFVSKYGETVVSATETVDFPVNTTNDPLTTLNQITVITPGVLGTKQVTYQVELRDGKEISRKVLQDVVTVQPQAQIQTRGTKTPDISSTDAVAWMRAAGIADSDFYYVDFIVGHEGGWGGVQKWNKAGSGAYGICQALPASKMASAGSDYMTNPVTQLKWCNGYAISRYGSWYGAFETWNRQGWW